MDPKLLDRYKAKQRDPVFIRKEEPETDDGYGALIRFALIMLAVFAAGFIGFFIFTAIRPFPF
jgi:hypothetical protein